MFDIRFEGKQPIYEQLSEGIMKLISAGVLAPDERLPTVREVAKSLGINPNTVQKSYSMLERAGFIYSIPAKGSYVSATNDAAIAVRAEALRKLSDAMKTAKGAGVSEEEARCELERVWEND